MQSARRDPRVLKRQKPLLRGAAFWDNLREILLTKSALLEVERRNPSAPPSQRPFSFAFCFAPDFLRDCTPDSLKKIKVLSRHRGPDVSDLRDCPYPGDFTGTHNPQKSNTQDTGTSGTSDEMGKNITAYSRNFEQHIIDHGVYPERYEFMIESTSPITLVEPTNMAPITQQLTQPRPSLPPPHLADDTFLQFRRVYKCSNKEHHVLADVIPLIEGNTTSLSHYSSGGYLFDNLAPLTDGSLVPANPGVFYGAHPSQLHPEVRKQLGDQIIPSTEDDSLPAVPNFFLEMGGPDGMANIAERQACYSGALGARAMHALRSFRDTPVYDEKAYTITAVYVGGRLSLYAHHVAGPECPGGRPTYRMTHLKSWALMNDAEEFRDAVTGYLNARDWAKEQRDEFIAAANGRVGSRRGDGSVAGV